MDKQDQKENKSRKNFIVILLILIALIIIIFLLIRNLGFIDHRPQIPTGNVDIFDIIFQKDCDNNKDCNCTCDNNCNNFDNPITSDKPDNSGGNSNSGSNNSSSGSNKTDTSNKNETSNNNNDTSNKEEEEPTEPPVFEKGEGVEVSDDKTIYSKKTTLDIFNNSTYYVVDNKIAPTSENSYQFVIRNNNEFNIKYDLDMIEENEYNINMKYRLKLNGVYVAGSDDEWITYKELKQENINLAANTYDVYTLDWKWFESSNDTKIGTQIDSHYSLSIRLFAEEK